MKTRNGFVSNSSSSSFIVGSKTELTKRDAFDLFEISPGAPFGNVIKEIAEEFFNDLGKPYTDIESFKDDFDRDEDVEYATKLFNDGFIVYAGSFTTEGEPAEALLCGMDINYDGVDFRIKHDGGP
jgi:hypothetical protein